MVRIMSVDIATLLMPWSEIVLDQVPGLELFDAHTHIGQNDPDGMKQRPQELIASLQMAHARGAFVFPMHEPDGYGAANDAGKTEGEPQRHQAWSVIQGCRAQG